MNKIIVFLKNWILPISMMVGILSYLIYLQIPALKPFGPGIRKFGEELQPILIFTLLLMQFNKISPKEIKIERWHIVLLAIQGVSFTIAAILAAVVPMGFNKIALECAMLCLICPSAITCGVMTEKLGGKLSSSMSYLLLINCLVSIAIPLFIPFVHSTNSPFIISFLLIIRKIFPMLILPCLSAWLIRLFLPRVRKLIIDLDWTTFYLWNFCLTISLALTTKYLLDSGISLIQAAIIGLVSLSFCIIQFFIGQMIGKKRGKKEMYTAGQALGQKNTVFMIWLGYTFMTPVTSVAGGFYCIWHNLVNSWELYKAPRE